MGFVRKRKDRPGWQAGYRGPDRKQYSKTSEKEADAKRWVTQCEADAHRGEWIDPNAGRETFREYAEKWRSVQAHRPRTAAQVETYLRRQIYPKIGVRPLSTLRRSDMQALTKALGVNLAPASVKLAMTWTSTILKAAVADGVIHINPASGVRTPAVIREQADPLPVETVLSIADAIDDRYRAVILLGLGSGVRISEALGLTVDRVDFLRRRVRIDRQLALDTGLVPTFGPFKVQGSTTAPDSSPDRSASSTPMHRWSDQPHQQPVPLIHPAVTVCRTSPNG